MKRFGLTIAAVAVVGLLLFSLSGCATPEQQYVTQVEKSALRLTNKLLQYTQNDATLSAEEKGGQDQLSLFLFRVTDKLLSPLSSSFQLGAINPAPEERPCGYR